MLPADGELVTGRRGVLPEAPPRVYWGLVATGASAIQSGVGVRECSRGSPGIVPSNDQPGGGKTSSANSKPHAGQLAD